MTWAEETMQIINKLTPDIKGKAFDPDWFLLRERLEKFETAVLFEANAKLGDAANEAEKDARRKMAVGKLQGPGEWTADGLDYIIREAQG